MIDMSNRPFFRQHEPLPTPDKWDDSERRFAHKLEQLLDELYQWGTKLRLLLRGEKVGDYGLSQNSYTDAEKEKLENIETLDVPVPIEKGGTGALDAASARKNLNAVRSNQDDDSLLVFYNPETNNMYIGWQDVNDSSNPNRTDIQATDGTGIYIHKRVNGTWTTVPQAISVGGTGATTVAEARNNLGLGNTSGALPVANGGTGATSANAALQNLGIAYKVNDTVTVTNLQTVGYISNGTKQIGFTVYPPKFMNAISTVTLTSLQAIIRTTAGGYINNNNASYIQYVGVSGYTVSAGKASNNAFRVTIDKSSAFTNVTNNTPVSINFNYTAKFT